MPDRALWVMALLVAVLAMQALHAWLWRKLGALLSGRPPLDDEAFAKLFPGGGDVAVTVRQQLKPYVRGDIRCILPGDRIVADLGVGAMDGLDVDEFLHALETAFAIRIPAGEAERARSVADVVNLVRKARDG